MNHADRRDAIASQDGDLETGTSELTAPQHLHAAAAAVRRAVAVVYASDMYVDGSIEGAIDGLGELGFARCKAAVAAAAWLEAEASARGKGLGPNPCAGKAAVALADQILAGANADCPATCESDE